MPRSRGWSDRRVESLAPIPVSKYNPRPVFHTCRGGQINPIGWWASPNQTEHAFRLSQVCAEAERPYGDVGGNPQGPQLLGRSASFPRLFEPQHSGARRAGWRSIESQHQTTTSRSRLPLMSLAGHHKIPLNPGVCLPPPLLCASNTGRWVFCSC